MCAIIKGSPDDIYFIIEEPFKQYSTKKHTLGDLLAHSFHKFFLESLSAFYFLYCFFRVPVTNMRYKERIEKGKMRMEEPEQTKREAQAELDQMPEVSGSEEISDEELKGLSGLEVFDNDKFKVLIEKVVVYGADAMEIVWKVRNPFGDGTST